MALNLKAAVLFAAVIVLFSGCPLPISHGVAKSSADPALTDIFITNDQKNVLLFARLINPFTKDMESAILAGVPVIFTLQLDVYRERSGLWEEKITGREIRRSIKYDNLKKTFAISTNGYTDPVILQDLESARKAMADFSGIMVVPISSLVKDNTYYAQIKVKIDKVRLPFYMEYVFFFVSVWDTETPAYRQRFAF